MKRAILTVLLAAAILVAIGMSSPVHAGGAFVASSSAFNTSLSSATSVTSTISATANDLLVVNCSDENSYTPTTATDTIGNTFTQFAIATDSTEGGGLTGLYAVSASTNANDVIACHEATAGEDNYILVMEYSGNALTSLIDTTSSFSTTTASTSARAQYTTTNANDIIVSFGNANATAHVSSTAPFTARYEGLVLGDLGGGGADLITSTVQTSQSSTWISGAASDWDIILGAFKVAATGATAANSTTASSLGIGIFNTNSTVEVAESTGLFVQ
jgi:hypothetical protein